MAKKKRRKSSGGGFAEIGRFIKQSWGILIKSIPILLILCALGASFMGIRSALYADSNLAVQKILIEPAGSISGIQREHLESEILGKNILNVDLVKTAASLERDPSIQNVRATRAFPAAIRFEIQRRFPVAYVQFARGASTYGVVSEDGVVLDIIQGRAAGLVMEAFGLGMTRPNVGAQIRNRGFLEAASFLKLYQNDPLSIDEPITKVMLDALGNVSILLKEGPEIRLGRRPTQRLEALQKSMPLLESDMRKKIDYIDLQYDDVVVKQKGAR